MPDKLTLEQLWRMELEQLHKEKETSDPDPDMWRWSPLEITKFAHMLQVAVQLAFKERPEGHKFDKLTFAEAGSGIGTKLYLAKYHFELQEIGYEINDLYLAMARKLNVLSVKCDLRKDKPPWEKYDIVYVARPFKSDEFEVAWEKEVMAAMRPHAVFMSSYAAVKPYGWQCYYRAPFRGVWLKPRAATYNAMIQRTTTGSDPLVQEPLSRR